MEDAALSRDVWDALWRMDEAQRLGAIRGEDAEAADVPTSAAVAYRALKRMGFEQEDIYANAPKLHGRPLSRVVAFVMAAEDEKPERHQFLLSQFAKKVAPLEGVA